MNSHYRVECKHGIVHTQCRCDGEKVIRIEACRPECTKEQDSYVIGLETQARRNQDHIEHLEEVIDKQRQDIEAAAIDRDTERVDWWSQRHGGRHVLGGVTYCEHTIFVSGLKSFREAIDEEMKK